MVDPGSSFTVELTQDELKITRAALRSFLQDFGHDERDVLDQVRAVLAKLPPEAAVERTT